MNIKVTLSFLLLPVVLVLAEPYKLTFNPSVSEVQGEVSSYSMWVQATNTSDSNSYKWIGQCVIGQTNIYFDSTNIPMNPCYVVATANNSVGTQGPYSQSILFDTNNFATPIVTTNVQWLVPPVLINIQKL